MTVAPALKDLATSSPGPGPDAGRFWRRCGSLTREWRGTSPFPCLGLQLRGGASACVPILDNGDKEILLWRSLRQGKGEGFEAGGFIEALRFALKEGSAKPLAGEEGGRFVGRCFLRKGNTEKEPGFLVGVVGEEVGKDGVGGPRLDGLRAVGTGEFSEPGEDEFEVVGDFSDGADGASGGADGVALAKGDGGGDSLDAANARASSERRGNEATRTWPDGRDWETRGKSGGGLRPRGNCWYGELLRSSRGLRPRGDLLAGWHAAKQRQLGRWREMRG